MKREKRTHEIKVRLNDSEYSSLTQKVTKSGLSRETFLRKIISGQEIKELPPIEFHEVLKALRQINNNFNQIARKANSFDHVNLEDYWENVHWLQVTVGKLMEGMYK